MTVFSPREKKGIYRGIFFVSKFISAWTRGFEMATFYLDFFGLTTSRDRWYSKYHI
jgi:hypothetical protein